MVKALRSDVYEYRGHLPWRKTRDAYKILVSEMMLQQTQVDRVMPFYGSFLKRFPTVNALAQAPLSDVLRAWQGLGYNRRGKYLHDAARAI
ncbi:MAG TPA: A/G-specific adenine glycosylase, partial [Candidatus Paceibacterota bacterium]